MSKWYCLLAFMLLAGAVPAQQIQNGSFETGDFSNWQADPAWTICGPDYTLDQAKNGKDGQYFASTFYHPETPDVSGETYMGNLKSPNYTIPTDMCILEFLIAGFNQFPGQTGVNDHNYVSIKRVSNGVELARAYAPQSNDFTSLRLDLKDYKGQQVYIEVVDNSDLSGYAWIAVDNFHFVAPPSESANLDFEMGNFTHWTATGVWAVFSAGAGTTAGSCQKSFFAKSTEGGTGTLRLENQTVPTDKPMLVFLLAGHSMYPVDDGNKTGPNAYNYVSIKKATDNSEITRLYAPNGDAFVEKQVDLSAVKGQQIYIEVVDDGALGGFAWLAVDDFHFIAVPQTRVVFEDFESGSFDTSKWTAEGNWEVVTAGQGFGGDPPQGTYAAKTSYDRASDGKLDSLTGVLTSKPIQINYQDTLLRFDMCGQDGQTAPYANQSYLEIFDASNLNMPVATIYPPHIDSFKPMSFDVTNYRNKQLVLKFTDSRTEGFGWMGVDNIRIEYDPNIVPVELSSFSAE